MSKKKYVFSSAEEEKIIADCLNAMQGFARAMQKEILKKAIAPAPAASSKKRL